MAAPRKAMPPAPSPTTRLRPSGPLEAIMVACRDAVTGYEAAEAAADSDKSDANVRTIGWARNAAGLFPPLDAQQALFAIACAGTLINIVESSDKLEPQTGDLLAQAQDILDNVATWLAAARGADLTAPEVVYHLRVGFKPPAPISPAPQA